MEDIQLIEGGISTDERGFITHINSLDMSEVRRFYIIHHPDMSVIRAWHAHRYEQKWFYVVKGAFTCAFVKIDNWENPSKDLMPEVRHLSDKKSEIIHLQPGYAIGLKAEEPGSVILVYSDKILSEALKDSWRYDKHLWMNWEK